MCHFETSVCQISKGGNLEISFTIARLLKDAAIWLSAVVTVMKLQPNTKEINVVKLCSDVQT